MNYELAKRLKDAGFPQGGDGVWDGGNGTIATQKSMVYVPTLSELLEACGDEFRVVEKDGNGWLASGLWDDQFGHEPEKGKTPEEAVANLWLALNEKKV